MTPSDRHWYARHPVRVAWDLVGCTLRVTRDGVTAGGVIVETEAYAGPDDAASHAGRLALARPVMSGPPGVLYVYRSYGIHTMLNVVAHEAGGAGGVLIRAVRPLEGLDAMRDRRGGVPDARLAKGPGALGQALGVRLTDIGHDLIDSDIFDIEAGEGSVTVLAGPRIGVSRAAEVPWRFFIADDRHVSAHRRGQPATHADLAALIAFCPPLPHPDSPG